MATDNELSPHEKIGFPDAYREGKASRIFVDILHKLAPLDAENQTILDIGPGCSDLPLILIEHCKKHGHHLNLIDSAEMLAHLPDSSFISKWEAYYPACPELFEQLSGQVNAILCYSVFHYIFTESNIWRFIDHSLGLLAPGGQMLIGDIPNVSKRKRFFSSAAGIQYHRAFTGKDEVPHVQFNIAEPDQIDDAVVLAILQRARTAGCDAYVLPQSPDLPMANRREDILITKP